MISLLRHMNHEQRRSWPSQAMICQETGLSGRWVRNTLHGLENKGYIETKNEPGKKSIYTIRDFPQNISNPGTEFPGTGHDDPGTQFRYPGTQFPSPRNSVPKTPELSSAEPYIEPNKEPNIIPNTPRARTRERNNSAPQNFDPWVAAQMQKIRQVVEAPKPGKLPELLAQWRETYGAQTVEMTVTRAMRWMQDNGKRYSDMGRFLGNWLARDAEKRLAPRVTRAVPDYGDTLPSWDELRRGERR